MPKAKGHETGHGPPGGATWERYVGLLVEETGGFTKLADGLIARVGKGGPTDRATVEKGLRRLAARGHLEGGDYGRWLVRSFGVPRPLEDSVRWLGQYHSRFSDLPLDLRAAELQRWRRPPITETSLVSWLELGLASVELQGGDGDAALARVRRCASLLGRAEPAARLEGTLLEARVSPRAEVAKLLEAADALLTSEPAMVDHDCYRARLVDQRAYSLLHPAGGAARDLAGALALYLSIPAPADGHPFAAFRREHGAAYCRSLLGERDAAIVHARAAVEHAGDGGYVRFRAMGLRLLADLVPAAEATRLRERIERMGP